MRQLFLYKCPECPKVYGLAVSWESWIFAFKRCQAQVADHELSCALHRTNHQLERIERGVYNAVS